MKKYILLLLNLMLITSISFGKAIRKEDSKYLKLFADEREIARVLDEFAVYADKKDYKNQQLLFTENGTVNLNNSAGKTVLKGRKQISETFEKSMANYDSIFHMNGQKVINVDGNNTTATSYCMTVLIGKNEKGEKIKRNLYVIYEDRFIYQNNKWLIAERNSHFIHNDSEVLPNN